MMVVVMIRKKNVDVDLDVDAAVITMQNANSPCLKQSSDGQGCNREVVIRNKILHVEIA